MGRIELLKQKIEKWQKELNYLAIAGDGDQKELGQVLRQLEAALREQGVDLEVCVPFEDGETDIDAISVQETVREMKSKMKEELIRLAQPGIERIDFFDSWADGSVLVRMDHGESFRLSGTPALYLRFLAENTGESACDGKVSWKTIDEIREHVAERTGATPRTGTVAMMVHNLRAAFMKNGYNPYYIESRRSPGGYRLNRRLGKDESQASIPGLLSDPE